MSDTKKLIYDAIEAQKDTLLETERWLWAHPAPGYKEWPAHNYLIEKYRALGYDVKEVGNIPGFWTDIDTGRPGPTVVVFGELDSLIVPTHPECDKETGAVHSCGHHCQSTGLLGVAMGLAAPGALDGLSGKIRLMAVPAEELIEIAYREELRQKGIIHYFGGKVEFMYRGLLDDADMAFMIHTTGMKYKYTCSSGSNGCITKHAIFRGKSAHASAPYGGTNALYAATNAINACNALRETFRDADHIRFHPIITHGGEAVNSIPDSVEVESYVRGATMDAIRAANEKVNRIFAASAAAMGCTVELIDEMGYSPRYNDKNLRTLFENVASEFYKPEEIDADTPFNPGCSDMGDISTVMPAIHPNCGGAIGNSHSSEYFIQDPYNACVVSAKVQCGALVDLLKDDAKAAKKVIAEKEVVFSSIKDYFEYVDKLCIDQEAVKYNEDGTVTLEYK